MLLGRIPVLSLTLLIAEESGKPEGSTMSVNIREVQCPNPKTHAITLFLENEAPL
jgi:hypothetical protein